MRYCHSDDERPSCYELASWERAGVANCSVGDWLAMVSLDLDDRQSGRLVSDHKE